MVIRRTGSNQVSLSTPVDRSFFCLWSGMDSDSGGTPRTQLACGERLFRLLVESDSFDYLWEANPPTTCGKQILRLLVEGNSFDCF